MSNKKRNKEIRLKYEKQKLIKENPNDCFCDDPEYDENNPIGETGKIFHSKYDYNKENPFSLPIFKCKKCGKRYIQVIVEA